MDKLRNWSIAGAVFTAITGALLHFVYDWFGGKVWSVLGAANESTWEHLKLIFWPVIIFAIIEYAAYGRKAEGFIPVKVLSALIGMAAIVIIFYTYTGVLGYNILAIDIATFFIGTAAAYLFTYRRLSSPKKQYISQFTTTCAVALAATLMIIFIIFTYSPPEIALFQDPITGKYGIDI